MPILFLGFYSSQILISSIKEKIVQTSMSQLEMIDKKIFEKIRNIQKSVDIIRFDAELQEVLMGNHIANADISALIKRKFKVIDGIDAIIFFSKSGVVYSYGIEKQNLDLTKFQVVYMKINQNTDELTWFGENAINEDIGIGRSSIVAGTDFYGYNTNREYGYLATVYFVVNTNIFANELYNSNNISIYDNKFRLFVKNNNTDVLTDNIKVAEKVYNSESGSFITYSYDQNMVVTYYTSPLNAWKLIKVESYNMFYSEVNKIIYTTLFLVLIMIAVSILIYIYIQNNILKPILKLSKKMSNFDKDILYQPIENKTKDEIGILNIGYNKMIQKVADMVEEVKKETNKKKSAEITALSYQINPHFLFNTLCAIRIMVIEHEKDELISLAIISLNRLLRNYIDNSDKLLSFSKELSLLNDYISLLQIRYKNRLNINYNIAIETRNLFVPSLILQPIIENSVLHGLTKKINCMETANLIISSKIQNEAFVIEVFDNGVGIEDDIIKNIFDEENKKKHIGLKNINDRIKMLFGDEYGLTISSEKGCYTTVKIKIPSATV